MLRQLSSVVSIDGENDRAFPGDTACPFKSLVEIQELLGGPPILLQRSYPAGSSYSIICAVCHFSFLGMVTPARSIGHAVDVPCASILQPVSSSTESPTESTVSDRHCPAGVCH